MIPIRGLRIATQSEPQARISAPVQRGIAQHVLVTFVEQVLHSANDAQPARNTKARRQIESHIAGIARQPQRRKQKVAVRPAADEYAGQISIETPERGIERDAPGIYRAAKQSVARRLDGVEGI